MSPASPGPPERVGVVLGAGGVLGAAWSIGALAALDATGIDARDAELLVGTSAGSVLAGFLGCGISAQTLVNHQRGVVDATGPDIDYDYEQGTGGALPPLPRFRLGSGGLLWSAARRPGRLPPMAVLSALLPQGRGSIASVGTLIDAVAPAGDAWAPHAATWIVAMDYASGRRVPFGRPGAPPARLADAVMASCAIPGWYEPVSINGRRYVDGGMCSATSLDLAAGLGLDVVYVLAPMASLVSDTPRSLPARAERGMRRLVTRRLLREAEKVRAGGTEVVLITPGPADLAVIGANLMDPRRRLEVFQTSLVTSAERLRAAGGSGLTAAG